MASPRVRAQQAQSSGHNARLEATGQGGAHWSCRSPRGMLPMSAPTWPSPFFSDGIGPQRLGACRVKVIRRYAVLNRALLLGILVLAGALIARAADAMTIDARAA